MLVLKIYLVGLFLFILYCGIRYIIEDSTSWYEFLLTLLLNVWLLPIFLYLRIHRYIKERPNNAKS